MMSTSHGEEPVEEAAMSYFANADDVYNAEPKFISYGQSGGLDAKP